MTTQAAVVVTEAPINPQVQLARFSDAFQLEGEQVGQSIRKRVSTKGAVRVDLMTKKDISAAMNLKGDALEAHVREIAVGLKSEMAAGFSRLASNPNWVGKAITMNGKGDAITFHLKKVKPLVISTPKAQLSDVQAAIGALPADKQAEALKALTELGFIDAKPEAPQPEDESETGPGKSASNGAVAS